MTLPGPGWQVWLVLAPVLLLPFGRSAEAGVIVAAMAGLVLMFNRRRTWGAVPPGSVLALALFACYWLPTFFSAFDSVVPPKSWQTVAEDLRFLPFAIFVGMALRTARARDWLMTASAVIVLAWVLDAWVQILTGFSLGGARDAQHLSGIFGADNLKLGEVLATLSPFVLLSVRQRAGRRGLMLAALLLLVPVLLAGEREAWISYAVVLLVMLWRETSSLTVFGGLCVGGLVLGAGLIVATARLSPGFDARLQRSLLVFEGTSAAVDEAGAGRLRIWHTALAMGAAHPVNGVGVRGFRYAYAAYAPPGDGFINPLTQEGAFHAHQLWLEVFSETGSIGVAAWLIGFWLALRAWWRAGREGRRGALAPALALLAMTFPINTHLAFYSAPWGLLLWWLLSVYCAALAPPHEPGVALAEALEAGHA